MGLGRGGGRGGGGVREGLGLFRVCWAYREKRVRRMYGFIALYRVGRVMGFMGCVGLMGLSRVSRVYS